MLFCDNSVIVVVWAYLKSSLLKKKLFDIPKTLTRIGKPSPFGNECGTGKRSMMMRVSENVVQLNSKVLLNSPGFVRNQLRVHEWCLRIVHVWKDVHDER